ncbi:cobalt-factor II C(20)-methyltransferase [Methanospirillum hungatei]|jgi:precorrin-2/cobalt-factor-2 C20-methyltransferase|uniref:cobalt-factor II C(20)-methyltransferase n=1 Tax=Methanospirillum hungatei TaxID=2203 RepID=UPI001B7849F8|nr:cobalt-factor II C(20)-methyltransferase [Methanospirillum hungatei]MBP7035042.1 cobalt-factor II C(20)-methyltransferase [Methanospirillum sp.]MBP9008221.1 cobalt-factor II C(20)-methyltransferase [Methanospirillum sp.]HOW05913.1 cobalt-factor II C(20)-methyltransferase [Methanospirillum hungatei]
MLSGVGLGPGDPELLTIKAVRMLQEADVVYIPGGLAKRLVEPYCTPIELPFPMSHDEEMIRAQIIENAEKIASDARDKNVVFGIIGDPNIFSTFSRLTMILKERYPDIIIGTVPGISSITALMSETGLPITGGFCVTDGSKIRSQIRMKVRKPRELAENLRKEGYSRFALVERMYMDGMQVLNGDDLPEESSYFSLLYAERDL